VLAIDVLEDALDNARAIAARHAAAVEIRRADLEKDAGAWEGSWDVIHVHRFLDRASFPLLRARLAPGGLLLISTFLEAQARAGRKPRSPAHLLRPGELLDQARSLHVLGYEERLTDRGDWLAFLEARRPGRDPVPATTASTSFTLEGRNR
jgi:hypothetical protein